MRIIFAVILFAFIAIAIIVMVIINFAYRGIKKMREAAEDSYYIRQKRKEQKEKNPFGNDYFKSTDSKSQGSRTQRQYTNSTQSRQSKSSAQEKTTTRKTTTSSGVTIIDDRETEEKKKIFDHNDGEYVEFEEVGE